MLQRNFDRLKKMDRLSYKVLICIAAALLNIAMPAHSDPEEIAWQDLVPPMDESFFSTIKYPSASGSAWTWITKTSAYLALSSR